MLKEMVQALGLAMFAFLHLGQLLHRGFDALRKPRGKDKGGKQRQKHRDGSQRGDRSHIGAHHAGNETHRQQGGDHGKGGKDCRIANLAHRIHVTIIGTFAVQQPSPIDVFHHHNGVIHQNPDGKD